MRMSGLTVNHSVPKDVVRAMIGTAVRGYAYTLDVIRNGQPARPRTYHVVTRMGPGHALGVFDNCVASVERALLERYFFCLVGDRFHQPLRPQSAAFLSAGLARFRAGVVQLVEPVCEPITTSEVVALYTGAKKKLYQRAEVSLSRVPLNRSDATLRPFTKFEKQPLNKACRIINPRSPRYNLALGRYLKHTEKAFYEAINDVWGGRTAATVIKGYNVRETAQILRDKWQMFKDPVAVGLDATKFDMHVSIEALEYEHSFYNCAYRCPDLAEILSWQLYNRGLARCPDGEVRFTMPGTRSSGDLNTSLGNCILMCAMIFELCQVAGVDAELCNNGDDCVLVLDRADLDKVVGEITPHFARLGFRMEVETPVDVFEQIEFCQSRPVWADGWVMVRNVRTCLQKDPMCLVPLQSRRVVRKWLGAVGEGGGALVSGVPVMQEFYAAFRRAGCRPGDGFKRHVYKNTSQQEREASLTCRVTEVSPAARASFYRAFGIAPDYQLGLEAYYRAACVEPGIAEGGCGFAEVSPEPCLGHL